MLPPAPSKIEEGLFRGAVADATFPPRGLLTRRLVEKKWVYALVVSDEVMAAFAIVDAGYLASGFCAVFDRGSRRLLADENPVLPSICVDVSETPGSARLMGPGISARVKPDSLKASWGPVEADLRFDLSAAPPPMTAIAPVGGNGGAGLAARFDFTQKTVLVPVEGEIRAGNARFSVSGARAGLDYTHGLLARDTAWRWAFGMGGRVAFNFSEGFLQGAGENTAWIDGEPRAAGRVRFDFAGSDPMSAWRIRGDEVDLVFRPEGFRAQTVDLVLIASKYVQPFGAFTGKVCGVEVRDLPGVTEDHVARW